MFRNIKQALCLVLLLFSCSSPDIKSLTIDESLTISQALIQTSFVLDDSVLQRNFFAGCYCVKNDSGILIIHTSDIGFVGQNLTTFSDSRSATFNYRTWTDFGSSPEFKIISGQLTLNKHNYNLGDEMVGTIRLNGSFKDSIGSELKKLGFGISGNFKCTLNDTSYTIGSFRVDLRKRLVEEELKRLELIAIRNPDSVLELHLNGRYLTSIPPVVSKFKNLKKLNLNTNNLSSLDIGILSQFVNLEELNLFSNSIKEIPIEISRLYRLKHLDISGNPIQSIPESMSEMNQLEILNLSTTTVNKIPAKLSRLHNLKVLNLEHTSIKSIPDSFLLSNALTELHLPDSITPFSIEKINLKSLETLAVPYDFLVYNEKNIRKLENLEWLYPSFYYTSDEEFSKKHRAEIKWITANLPNVNISPFYVVDSPE